MSQGVEEIQRAMARLDDLMKKADPWPWKIDPEDYGEFGGVEMAAIEDGESYMVGDWMKYQSAALIVTLHRSAAAQYAHLKWALENFDTLPASTTQHAVRIARAINGVSDEDWRTNM